MEARRGASVALERVTEDGRGLGPLLPPPTEPGLLQLLSEGVPRVEGGVGGPGFTPRTLRP